MQSLELIRTAGDNDQDESAVFAQGKSFFYREIIVLCVRWYLRYKLSSRALTLLLLWHNLSNRRLRTRMHGGVAGVGSLGRSPFSCISRTARYDAA
jgi:hypothetical protein